MSNNTVPKRNARHLPASIVGPVPPLAHPQKPPVLPLRTSAGHLVPLREVIRLHAAENPSRIKREDQHHVITVSAEPAGGHRWPFDLDRANAVCGTNRVSLDQPSAHEDSTVKITLMTMGSRGDIQPYVCLAHRLQEAGHEVLLTTQENLVDFVTRAGIPAHRITGDAQKILESEEGKQWLSSGNMMAFLNHMKGIAMALKDQVNHDLWQACQGAEAIIAHPLTEDHAFDYGEKLGLPVMRMFPFPALPSAHLAQPVITAKPLPFRLLNRLSHLAIDHLWWNTYGALINERRRAHGLKPAKQSSQSRFDRLGSPALMAYSEQVVPRPADWRPETVITGYWHLSDDLRARLGEGEPPSQLIDWLNAGDEPLFIGFGSMPVTDPEATLAMVKRVARQMKQRILIGAGWSAFSDRAALPEDVFIVKAVNHDWLFPKCRAIVHHGGAGTTAASLRAGVPTLVASVFADQPYWGETVARLGAGSHIPYKRLTEDRLVQALRAIQSDAIRYNVRSLSQRLLQEDGLQRAVEAIERLLPGAPIPRL